MPRVTHSQHPLQFLRFILGPHVTQEKLAKMLGVTKSYVRAIENRQRAVSENLLTTITTLFGLPSQFFDMEVATPGSEEYATDALFFWTRIQYWNAKTAGINADAPNVFEELFVEKLRAVVESAVRKGRAMSVLMNLDRWIRGTVEEFGLNPNVGDNYLTTQETEDGGYSVTVVHSPQFRVMAGSVKATVPPHIVSPELKRLFADLDITEEIVNETIKDGVRQIAEGQEAAIERIEATAPKPKAATPKTSKLRKAAPRSGKKK